MRQRRPVRLPSQLDDALDAGEVGWTATRCQPTLSAASAVTRRPGRAPISSDSGVPGRTRRRRRAAAIAGEPPGRRPERGAGLPARDLGRHRRRVGIDVGRVGDHEVEAAGTRAALDQSRRHQLDRARRAARGVGARHRQRRQRAVGRHHAAARQLERQRRPRCTPSRCRGRACAAAAAAARRAPAPPRPGARSRAAAPARARRPRRAAQNSRVARQVGDRLAVEPAGDAAPRSGARRRRTRSASCGEQRRLAQRRARAPSSRCASRRRRAKRRRREPPRRGEQRSQAPSVAEQPAESNPTLRASTACGRSGARRLGASCSAWKCATSGSISGSRSPLA